jgi:cysteinyl-tRNA synthetase
MDLKIYNTLTRKKEPFEPVKPGRVHIYVCGPTVYSHAHIGHAKSYVSFDVVVKWFRYLGYRVKYVQNITDVGHLTDDADEGEDKLEKKAREEQMDPMQVATMYTWSFFDDMQALGVQRPDISPHATGHIIEQIEMIKALIAKGYAYESNGSVYFDVRQFSEYGKLSRRKVDEMEAGARIAVHSDKRHPADFALWKKADESHLMRWPSPWSNGYPGWHIECSAMAMKYLGETLDIHGGGIDNIFPHHECEIAQSESLTGKPFAKFWMHNNTLTINGEKMSKSVGNVLNIKDALKQYSKETLRFFLLNSHYRSRMDFTHEAAKAAEQGLTRLFNTVNAIQKAQKKAVVLTDFSLPFSPEEYRRAFEDAMNDDFNAPKGISVLFDLAKATNTYLAETAQYHAPFLDEIHQIYQDFGSGVLGILPEHLDQFDTSANSELIEKLVLLTIDIRKELRGAKLWSLSDKIRDGLKAIGITLKDNPDGTTDWEIES